MQYPQGRQQVHGHDKAGDLQTLDSGAGNKGKGAGRSEAGDFKTLNRGAGNRTKGAGRNGDGDFKTKNNGETKHDEGAGRGERTKDKENASQNLPIPST